MNLFAISSIITTFASFGFGLFVYSGDRKSIIGQRWLILSICIGLWALGLYGVTTADFQIEAQYWQTLLDISAICIPLAYLRFALAFLKVKLYSLQALVALGTVILAILSFTPLYSHGVQKATQLGFFWIQPGSLYFLFPLFYLIVTLVALLLLYRSYITMSHDALERGQTLNHMIAAAVGFSGGITNFFPQLFNVYPFGNYFVILYVVLMSYAVIRYKIFDIKLVSAQLFAGGLVLAGIFNLFDADSVHTWFIRAGYLFVVSLFSVQLVRSVFKDIVQREMISQQKQELELINQQQETLLHFVTHEIKGYLTKNQAAFAAIVEGDFGTVTPELQKMAQTALADVKNGVSTVMDILSASNMKKGTVTFKHEQFDIKEATVEIIKSLTPAAEERNLTLESKVAWEGNFSIVGDRENITTHVLRNLIDNAIRYTPAGFVTVELTRVGNFVRFSVQDTGVGITPEDMKRLFTEGGHGKDSIKVNVHSTGFGLFIAKSIVDAHHGKIWAESAGAGKGSKFIVELPTS